MTHVRSTAGRDAIVAANQEKQRKAAERRARQKLQAAARARQAYDGCPHSAEELSAHLAALRLAFYARRGLPVPA